MSLELVNPAPGTVWPVGSTRSITWNGTGRVDLYLSVDGGHTWGSLGTALSTKAEFGLTVPHVPTKFAMLRLQREVPGSVVATSGFFSIDASVSLLNMLASALPEGGATISWRTDPGPEDLTGYRVEKSAGASAWQTLVARTRETTVTDPQGGPGMQYRLFAVNGLGEESFVGETSIRPLKPLAAWPLPYRGGSMQVMFATSGGLGGGAARAELMVFDVQGRLVRRVAGGEYAAGYQSATWDGRDARGVDVPAGVYFLRSRTGAGPEKSMKVTVLR